MSFVKKIATGFTFALAMFTLTTFVAAQDNNTTTDKQSEKPMKERRWGRGGGDGFGKGMRGGRRGGGFGMHGLNKLDLTDAQKEQIKGIMETTQTANEPLRQEMRALMEKRRNDGELTESDRVRIKELRTQMKQSTEQTHGTILGILTPEQRQKLEQIKQEKQQRREQFRQRRQENKPTSLEKNDGK